MCRESDLIGSRSGHDIRDAGGRGTWYSDGRDTRVEENSCTNANIRIGNVTCIV